MSALGINLAFVGEGEDTGFVLSREAFCGAALVTVLPLVVDDLSVGVDLSGAPGQFRVGLRAGLVGHFFVGKGEGFADLEFAMGASHHGAVSADTVVITTVHDIQVCKV